MFIVRGRPGGQAPSGAACQGSTVQGTDVPLSRNLAASRGGSSSVSCAECRPKACQMVAGGRRAARPPVTCVKTPAPRRGARPHLLAPLRGAEVLSPVVTGGFAAQPPATIRHPCGMRRNAPQPHPFQIANAPGRFIGTNHKPRRADMPLPMNLAASRGGSSSASCAECKPKAWQMAAARNVKLDFNPFAPPARRWAFGKFR